METDKKYQRCRGFDSEGCNKVFEVPENWRFAKCPECVENADYYDEDNPGFYDDSWGDHNPYYDY